MPLDHSGISVPASALVSLANFLTTTLSSLGFTELHRIQLPNDLLVLGLGEANQDIPAAGAYFWLSPVPAELEAAQRQLLKLGHICFKAENATQVRECHTAALKAGATCDGPPGLRPQYHDGYYAAFVKDPVLGIKWEILCRKGDI